MRTKERLSESVRMLCFALLLAATAIRLAVAFYQKQPATPAPTQEVYPTMLYEPKEDEPLFFGSEPSIENSTGKALDLQKLLNKKIKFSLTQEPQILIVHTHATEAYRESADARSRDTSENVVHIGSILAQTLRENGIATLHDETLIDADGYYDAYARAAELIEAHLEKNPSIKMVIDVHRDSVVSDSGEELPMTTQLNGRTAAQLMLVMGTDQSGLYHPNWEDNLAFALELQAFCEDRSPGLFRNLILRSQRYNQHLTPQSILLEVGTAGNTLQEAEISIRFFATCLAELLQSQ